MSRAWEVAIIVEPVCDPATVSTLSGHMPVWIVDTPGNAASIVTAWSESRDCTSFKILDPEDRCGNLLNNFDTIELHHPSMTLVNIVGLDATETLLAQLASVDFVPTKQSWLEAISFHRLHIDWNGAPTFFLDATNWKTSDDVYDTLFAALKSPPWHGRNLNALSDSIMTGQINDVEPPFQFVVEEINHAAPDARAFLHELMQLIHEFQDRGCPISISFKS